MNIMETPGTAENMVLFGLAGKGTKWKIHTLQTNSSACPTAPISVWLSERWHAAYAASAPVRFWQENGEIVIAEIDRWKQERKSIISIGIWKFTQRPSRVPRWSYSNKAYQLANFTHVHKAIHLKGLHLK